jgi:5-methylcytosine-specific restriction endonuclease McrA
MAISRTSFKKGHPTSQALRDKSSLRCKTNPPHLGKKHSQETKERLSRLNKGKNMGENNGNWRGGVRKIEKAVRVMSEYLKWRSDVFQKDNWTCKTCNANNVYVTAHHIKSFINIIRENNITNIIEARNCQELWDISNGVTLCEKCHSLTDNYKGRSATKKL